jgi:transposase
VLSIPRSIKIFLGLAPVDLRKGFDSLAALVETVLAQDPLSGQLFVFRNKRADRIKLLYWDGDGYAIWYKRLESGSFRFPASPEEPAVSLTVSAADLTMLLDGVDLASVRRRLRYRRPA